MKKRQSQSKQRVPSEQEPTSNDLVDGLDPTRRRQFVNALADLIIADLKRRPPKR